jgi:MYXO-CTERM domain-containing protein
LILPSISREGEAPPGSSASLMLFAMGAVAFLVGRRSR